jgi:hypothetical protein
MRKFNVYGFIYIGWANTAFYWFGNAAGGLAFAGALLIVWLLTHGAFALLRKK